MSKLCFIVSCLSLIVFAEIAMAQEARLESEYKLAVPKEDFADLWRFIQSEYAHSDFELNGLKLSGSTSIETFIDTYFDEPDGSFAEQEISLRYRKRFKDGQLLKQLVQLKTPYSKDKVIRQEVKFEVNEKRKVKDLNSRHDFLKLFSKSDLERMSYHLAKLKLRPEEIISSLKLKQIRKRVYIADDNDESIATITLDEVSNFSFPFQSFVELELELNELKYTAADLKERERMTALNNKIKRSLADEFPALKVDQRSKYIKMKLLIDESRLSYFYDNIMWVFFGLVTALATFYFIKDQLS